MKDIAIFGAGGFGREIACLIKQINKETPVWNIIGFIDDNPALQGTKNEYGEVLGGIEVLNHYNQELAIAIAIGNPSVVRKVVGAITNDKIWFPNLVAPDVIIMDEENFFGVASVVLQQKKIGYKTVIGGNSMIIKNTKDGRTYMGNPAIAL